jgi:hypothetical protein
MHVCRYSSNTFSIFVSLSEVSETDQNKDSEQASSHTMSACETDGVTMIHAPCTGHCAEVDCDTKVCSQSPVYVCEWCMNWFCCIDGCFLAHQDYCQQQPPEQLSSHCPLLDRAKYQDLLARYQRLLCVLKVKTQAPAH